MEALNHNKVAQTIKAGMAVKNLSRKRVAEEVGLNRVVFGMYLRREIDLLPGDIDRIFVELGIQDIKSRLSSPSR